jgi:hypothetical protein
MNLSNVEYSVWNSVWDNVFVPNRISVWHSVQTSIWFYAWHSDLDFNCISGIEDAVEQQA